MLIVVDYSSGLLRNRLRANTVSVYILTFCIQDRRQGCSYGYTKSEHDGCVSTCLFLSVYMYLYMFCGAWHIECLPVLANKALQYITTGHILCHENWSRLQEMRPALCWSWRVNNSCDWSAQCKFNLPCIMFVKTLCPWRFPYYGKELKDGQLGRWKKLQSNMGSVKTLF